MALAKAHCSASSAGLGVAMILFQAGGLLLASLGYPTGVIEHTVAAITGASVLRVLLLLVP